MPSSGEDAKVRIHRRMRDAPTSTDGKTSQDNPNLVSDGEAEAGRGGGRGSWDGMHRVSFGEMMSVYWRER